METGRPFTVWPWPRVFKPGLSAVVPACGSKVEGLAENFANYSFALTLQLREHGCKPIAIIRWDERKRAESFAAWLRSELEIPEAND
jgi:hypothetical protein